MKNKKVALGELMFGKKEHKIQMRRVRQLEKTRDIRTINMADHTGWGNSIYWLDYKKRKLTGHLTPVPEVGDKVICEMKSPSKFRHFRIFTVARMLDFADPPDQFFVTVNDSGYIIETKERAYKFELGYPCPLCKKRFRRNFSAIDQHVGKKHKELVT